MKISWIKDAGIRTETSQGLILFNHDENTLTEISKITGGQYFRATDLESLKNIYKQIDEMEKSEVKVIDHSEYKEIFHYFLVPGLVLLFLEITLSNTILRRIP